jgi:hypothetical protein
VTGHRARWPVYYTVVLLLCAAVFISYIDRTNISIGAIAMKTQLGLRVAGPISPAHPVCKK